MAKELINLNIKKVNKVKNKNNLDTEVQKLSAELLEGKAGSISVMDIYTGEVIACILHHLIIQIHFYLV